MIRAERNEKQELEALKTKMKTQPMSAEEWRKKHYPCKRIFWYFMVVEYSDYLLKYHLKQFAEECKENAKLTHKLNEDLGVNKKGFHFVITRGSINQTLNDYLTKNKLI